MTPDIADEQLAETHARLRREAEVAELIAKANDPADPYDGHHGNDRTAEEFLSGSHA